MIDFLSLGRAAQESAEYWRKARGRGGEIFARRILDAHNDATGYGTPFFFVSGKKPFPPTGDVSIYSNFFTEHGDGHSPDPFLKGLFAWHRKYLDKRLKHALEGSERMPPGDIHSGLMSITDHGRVNTRIRCTVFALVDPGFRDCLMLYNQFRKSKQPRIYSLPESGNLDLTLPNLEQDGYIINGVTLNIPKPLESFKLNGLTVRFSHAPRVRYHMTIDKTQRGQVVEGLVTRRIVLDCLLNNQTTRVNPDLMG